MSPTFTVKLWLWTRVGPLRAFPVVSVSKTKTKTKQNPTKQKRSNVCYKIILGSVSLAGDRQSRTSPAETPEVMGLALAMEVHPAWPTNSLHHSCPHSALTLSTFWHWFNPSFQTFSTSDPNFFYSFLLMPSLNQAALFWHWNAAKLWPFCHTLRSHDRGWGNKMTRPEVHLKKEK